MSHLILCNHRSIYIPSNILIFTVHRGGNLKVFHPVYVYIHTHSVCIRARYGARPKSLVPIPSSVCVCVYVQRHGTSGWPYRNERECV